MGAITWVGFDGDDTLWKSEDYYRAAEREFEQIIGQYIDLTDARTLQHLLEVERRNLRVFGYGAKGMTLSMIESAVQLTSERISARDIHRVIEIGRATLEHPVELLEGVRESVRAIAADFEIVLITKGDLFHQESKIEKSGLANLFHRIEVVSEKDVATYARVLRELRVEPSGFVMIGNSLRSDIEPVVQLG
ncbi:MAG: HAD family hydrolase, partial [Lysobacteraceae bacterium]